MSEILLTETHLLNGVTFNCPEGGDAMSDRMFLTLSKNFILVPPYNYKLMQYRSRKEGCSVRNSFIESEVWVDIMILTYNI